MLLGDVVRFLRLCLRSPASLAAENLFLRKQLALYQERHVKPRRATNAICLVLIWLGRWFDWRQALAVVQPAAFLLSFPKIRNCYNPLLFSPFAYLSTTAFFLS